MRCTFLLLTVLLSLPLGAQPKTPVEVTLQVKTRWRSLSPTSAVALSEAGAVTPSFTGLHREFFLPRQELVLGEPVLVEYRVWTEGQPWLETMGGRYRGSGRDDNFVLLLQRGDGSWVDDPYGQVMNLGGLSTKVEARKGKTLHHWLPLQRWCALREPGEYTLYALHWRNDHTVWGRERAINAQLPERFRFEETKGLIDVSTGQPSETHQLNLKWDSQPLPPSPLKLASDLVKELERRQLDPRELSSFARFPLLVKAGQPDLGPWLELANQERESWPNNRATAARLALWYSQVGDGSHLLPFLQTADSQELTGLALHPNPEAARMLTRANPEQVLHSLHRLRQEHRDLLRPWLKAQTGGPHAEAAQRTLEGW